jgi:hypothetical protein
VGQHAAIDASPKEATIGLQRRQTRDVAQPVRSKRLGIADTTAKGDQNHLAIRIRLAKIRRARRQRRERRRQDAARNRETRGLQKVAFAQEQAGHLSIR